MLQQPSRIHYPAAPTTTGPAEAGRAVGDRAILRPSAQRFSKSPLVLEFALFILYRNFVVLSYFRAPNSSDEKNVKDHHHRDDRAGVEYH
ncbi:hypothetical protein [Burkholderia sp. Bp8963]|uniref:hypothetical protein n=1 Tax=Burkholderia sp. Bp8963 TaxID=2184547 RepID=UPI0011CFCE51|nr:hypothetical protein [Burkholderia sp. Bp8963]